MACGVSGGSVAASPGSVTGDDSVSVGDAAALVVDVVIGDVGVLVAVESSPQPTSTPVAAAASAAIRTARSRDIRNIELPMLSFAYRLQTPHSLPVHPDPLPIDAPPRLPSG